MRLSQQLSGIGFLSKSYSFKFLFIAFLGIHIPLIGIILYLVFKTGDQLPAMNMFVLTLVLTLGATAVTLFLLNQLLAPIRLSKHALVSYVEHDKSPELPTGYKDEAGVLMQSIQGTLTKLSELDVERNDLLSLLSHDLRTPLSQIISINKLIKIEDAENKLREYTNLIDACAENQLNMVEQIFMILKLRDYTIREEELIPLNLWSMVNKQMRLLNFKAADKQVILENNVDASLSIRAKEMMFERVIFNLLINAVKFSHPESKVIVEVKQAPGSLQIIVRDSGIGFAPEKAETLFERFTPLARSGTSGEHSEGLGLHLCRKIVEQHRGTIHAMSEGNNKGASFIITFPGTL
jgi:signal transduction histidine kinase